MDFDKLLTLRPVNKQAGVHLAKNGEHYKPTKNVEQPGYTALGLDALPVRGLSDAESRDPSFADLCGFKWGRFVVVGPLDTSRTPGIGSKNWSSVRWVCRCVCGAYEVRKTKVVRRANPDEGECASCGYQRALKEGLVSGVVPKLRNAAGSF